MAAIKANAYGHGAAAVARALDDADAFAVASYAEAKILSEAGIRKPIVLLGGVLDADELYSAVERGFQIVVHDFHQLGLLEQSACAANAEVWIKVDSGMHRLGFIPEDVPGLQERLVKLSGLKIAGWMTHLACADDTGNAATTRQVGTFSSAVKDIKTPRSIANSAGIIAWPASHAEWVRPGIMLYGASPLQNRNAADIGLKPAMTLYSRVLGVRCLRKGDAVGYGGIWLAPEDLRIAIVAAGYGDGYPRHARNGTPVLVKGRRCPLVGRVSMDMICVDLRGHDDVQEGDEVVLWGEGLAADEVAASADTIAYELFCRLTRRVEFEYQTNN
jgi:alanine racemase